MPYTVVNLHPVDWANANNFPPIPEAISKIAVGQAFPASAMTTFTGVGQPNIWATAPYACFFASPTTTNVVPPNTDPPSPPVYPVMFSSGDIYGRNNLNQNLKLVRKDDFIFDISAILNGAALDLTGSTLYMTAKYNLYDTSAVFSLSSPNGGITITNATGGLAEITIASALTSTLPEHTTNLYFDIEQVTVSGFRKTLLYGTLTVYPNVTP